MEKIDITKTRDYQHEIDHLYPNERFDLTETDTLYDAVEILEELNDYLDLRTDINSLIAELKIWYFEINKWKKDNEKV